MFLVLTSRDQQVLVNLDNVTMISPTNNGCALTFISSTCLNVQETLEKVNDMILVKVPKTR